MGVDWLDNSFRLEKSFAIRIRRGDLERLLPVPIQRGKQGVRCKDVHELVTKLCAEQRIPVPYTSWTRVKLCIMHGCGAKATRVKPEAWLVDDVGCC